MSASTESSILVCPETKLPLRECPLAEAEQIIANGAPLKVRPAEHAQPFGRTPTVMLRSDHRCAYPVYKGLPILIVPEMLLPPDSTRTFDLRDRKYAEAYEEMDHYNKVAEEEARDIAKSRYIRWLDPLRNLTPEERARFPYPWSLWLDATFDSAAQMEAYAYIGSIAGQRVMQLGGSGLHAVKFLLADAAESWLLTPMSGEAITALALARHYGVESRMRCVVAVAEELPFADQTFDTVYSGGCVHHMATEIALPEIARILQVGGKFGAIDPWRAPLYALGIRTFGKRERNVYCKPITEARAQPVFTTFENAHVVQHGALTRYPLLAASKIGLKVGLGTAFRLFNADDAFCALIPPLRRMGSSVAMVGTRGANRNGNGNGRNGVGK